MTVAAAPVRPPRTVVASRRDPVAARGTADARIVIGAVSIAALLLGAFGAATGAGRLRTGELLVFCLLGLGSAPWQLASRPRLPERIALSFLSGWALLTFVPLIMIKIGAWHPIAAFVPVAVLAVALHGIGVWRALSDLRGADPGDLPWAGPGAPLVLSIGGALLCVGSALAHQHVDPAFWGFLPRIGPLWFIGLTLVLFSMVVARAADREADVAVPVLLLTLVLTLTPGIVYDGPRSQSSEKHVDLVQQIRLLHRPRSSVQIYNSWDGFFAAAAWLCDVTGVRDPLRLATLWPAILGVFRVAALRYLFGRVLPSVYAAWCAVALAVLADPTGADYFSPQSVGFVLAVIVFALSVNVGRISRRVPLLLLAGSLLAVTHQLSPYVCGGVLALLVLFRQIRPWWLPATVLAPAVAWALLHAGDLHGFLNLADIGHLQNFRPPKTDGSSGLPLARLPVVGDTVRALLIGVALLGSTAVVALLRKPRERSDWAYASCPAVGLLLVAINPYGQEGIFRALIFGLPWLALLAARVLGRTSSELRRPVLGALAALLTLTYLAAGFGLDAVNVVRPGDITAVRTFQAIGRREPERTPAMLVLGTGDLPTSPTIAGGTYDLVLRDDLKAPVREEPTLLPQVQVRQLTAKLLAFTEQDPRVASLYALWSPVSAYYGWAYGVQTPDQFRALRDAFLTSGYWRPVVHQDGTYLFAFDPAGYRRATAS